VIYNNYATVYMFAQDVVCSHICEKTIGSEIKVHCVLFNIDDYHVSTDCSEDIVGLGIRFSAA